MPQVGHRESGYTLVASSRKEALKPRVYDDINSVEESLKERARRAGYGALLD
jgi:hypothetical protein